MTGKTKLENFVKLRSIYKLKKQFQFVHVWLAVAQHGNDFLINFSWLFL